MLLIIDIVLRVVTLKFLIFQRSNQNENIYLKFPSRDVDDGEIGFAAA